MNNKKQVRKDFRNAVFSRDKYACRCCGVLGLDRQGGDEWKKYHPKARKEDLVDLDSHHIIERTLIENGGYVKENGISVCTECHLKCEEYWVTGKAVLGYSIEELFALIGSSEEMAHEVAKNLK